MLLALPLWLVVGFCSLLPLGWMAGQILLHPSTLGQIRLSSFRAELLGRTLLYNGSAALLALLMAIPAALAIGRRRGWAGRLLLALLPLSLLYPSIAYTYGWSHVFLLMGLSFEPGGTADVLRCIWTLASWLWALPAVGIGLALRHLDVQLQQQAAIDGALWRITARLLIGPAWACCAATMVLAIQEFAVYEPSGISVMATEIRTVFETGMPGGAANAIVAVGGGAGLADQAERSAAAIATSIPLLGIVLVLFVLAAWGMKGFTAAEATSWPPALDAGRWSVVVSYLLWTVNLLLPTAAMVLSLTPAANAWAFCQAVQPQVTGSIIYGVATGVCVLVMAFLALARRSPWLLAASIATFLIGGQLLAIADIRIYNQRTLLGVPLEWVYNGPLIVVMAYVGRFGWLALLAAEGGWSRPFAELRELAALDGAGRLRTAAQVVWPLVWPMLAGAAVLVLILSLTELPATALLIPLNPPVLVSLLMTWVHQLKYDAMLLGSLLLVSMTALLAIVLVLLLGLGLRLARWSTRRRGA